MRRLRVIGTVLAAVAALVLGPPIGAAAVTTSTTQTYIVLYKDGASSSGAQTLVGAAGGTLVANYSQIGVVIARSNRSDFRDHLMLDSRVQGASATTRFASKLDEGNLDASQATTTITTAGPDDTLDGLQWDMNQIQAPEAHAITEGSSSVLVGDLDTGLDWTHPDLAPNVSFANSASCESGVADPTPAAWMDHNGHGTHTAGTIAAAHNAIGIVGVAPGVRIAGVKTGNDDGFFFPEAVVCAFMWAGDHHFTVTNNSYFADPWYFNCKNDPEQRAIWTAERRAISFAMKQGVMVVSAMGNFDDDLAHPTQDVISPDTGPGTTRTVHNDCAVIPVEVPGVIGVSATGDLSQMSFYSNYGVSVVDVAAPGGDSILQRTTAAPNGRVLSTYPAAAPCARLVVDVTGAHYCYLQGTSMASPHVVGVVALIASTGVTSAGRIESILEQSATAIACPTPAVLAQYAPFPSTANGAPVACQGGMGYNSWYGHGEVNALNAVS
jgi:subtilisin family serine protease